jgi:LPXTG-site transpeptidase (sortase) family protein
MLAGRRPAAAIVAAGLIAAGAGTAGLLLTRHPTVVQAAAVRAFPAPTGPIAAVPQRGTAAVPRPVALEIPAIGVSTSLVRLGLTSDGSLQVPSSTTVAGWYTGSPRPGATGSAVIAGHIDSYQGPGIFFRLSDLKRGDRVYVRRADGSLAVFQVTTVRGYAKDRFPTQAVYGPVPDPELRLITCGGTFDYRTKSYLSNTIVYATEIS